MRYYITRPVLVSLFGDELDEEYRCILEGDQSRFRKNSRGLLVGRYKESDNCFDDILWAAVRRLTPDAEKIRSLYDPSRVAVLVGGCDYQCQAAVKAHRDFIEGGSFGDYDVEVQNPIRPVRMIAEHFGFTGPSFAIATACSSSNMAAIRAIDLLDSGYIDAALVGGIDYASDVIVSGFNSLSAVSPEVTNPFSRNRKGITAGDGAGLYFITRECIDEEFKVAITGYAENSDGYNMTSPEPEGRNVAACMRKALASAGISPSEIGYINLHGTGTRANDSMEAKAVAAVFPPDTPVSSTKALTGHILGAAGAFGVGMASFALSSEQPALLPPHIYDGEDDPALPSLHFVHKGERRSLEYAMSAAYAFGGSNSVLVLKRCADE